VFRKQGTRNQNEHNYFAPDMNKAAPSPADAPNKSARRKLVVSPAHMQARKWFDQTGTSVAQWAREKGYHPSIVYRVLGGRITKRGKSHEVAVLLGIKAGVIASDKGGAK
jgi:gp16 family phage-associated protein